MCRGCSPPPAKKKKKKHGMSVASSCDPPRLSSSKRSKRGIQEVAKWQFWSNTQPPSWKWFLARLVILPLHNSMNLQPAGWLLAMVVKEVCDIILPSAMEYMRIAAWICSLGASHWDDACTCFSILVIQQIGWLRQSKSHRAARWPCELGQASLNKKWNVETPNERLKTYQR